MGWLVVEVALVAVVCFLIGSVNPASLVARAMGRDLRVSGSGNPGATNAGRVLGRKWGVLVLVLDVLKAYLPTVVVLRTMGTVPALVAGLAVVLGHVFSPFLGGRGGRERPARWEPCSRWSRGSVWPPSWCSGWPRPSCRSWVRRRS